MPGYHGKKAAAAQRLAPVEKNSTVDQFYQVHDDGAHEDVGLLVEAAVLSLL